MSRNWFLDTNLLAIWTMARGGLLEHLQETFGLPDLLVEAYRNRFQEQTRLFDAIDKHVASGGKDQFFISTLALNELFQAVKHEACAVLSFKAGIPVSQWRNHLQNRTIDETSARGIIDATLRALADLQEQHHLQVIIDRNPIDDDDYWNFFGPMLFLMDHAGTMDTTLAVTALLHEADAIISEDQSFRRTFKRSFAEATGMKVLSSQHAAAELRR